MAWTLRQPLNFLISLPFPPRDGAALIFFEEGASDIPPVGPLLERAGAFTLTLSRVAEMLYSANPLEVDGANLVLGSYSFDARQESAILGQPRIIDWVVQK